MPVSGANAKRGQWGGRGVPWAPAVWDDAANTAGIGSKELVHLTALHSSGVPAHRWLLCAPELRGLEKGNGKGKQEGGEKSKVGEKKKKEGKGRGKEKKGQVEKMRNEKRPLLT